jgi:4-carboxymuconolactone decarboxylase
MDESLTVLRQQGEMMRRRVAGDAWVDASSQAAVNFGAEFQNLVTAFAWGGVWAREGLSLRDRSIATIAVLTALHRPDELKLHLAGGVRNGLTKAELEEIMIQVGVYAGFPAAVAGNRAGQAVFREMESAQAKDEAL